MTMLLTPLQVNVTIVQFIICFGLYQSKIIRTIALVIANAEPLLIHTIQQKPERQLLVPDNLIQTNKN